MKLSHVAQRSVHSVYSDNILSNHVNWVTIDFSGNNELFGLIFSGDSMAPQFQESTLLVIDTSITPKNRDFVLVHINHNEDIVFRQIFIEGKCTMLRAINPVFPSIKLEAEDKIIGTLIQSTRKYL